MQSGKAWPNQVDGRRRPSTDVYVRRVTTYTDVDALGVNGP